MPTEMNPVFKISPNSVFEAFDDEIIVINLQSGNYYSLDAVALNIWTLLQKGLPLNSVISIIHQKYQGELAAIAVAVEELTDELVQEGLILRGEAVAESIIVDPVLSTRNENAPIFQKPVLTKFTDMKDLMLLDPIHEVDEMGWPHAKAAPSSEE